MANNDKDLISNAFISKLSANTISANTFTTGYGGLYDRTAFTVDSQTEECGIDGITGREMLEVIQKGIYKTLVNRRDDAKALWEEEDDDASYGEYKALKDAVELLDAFMKNAPHARYSGLKQRRDGYGNYDRYDGFGRRF